MAGPGGSRGTGEMPTPRFGSGRGGELLAHDSAAPGHGCAPQFLYTSVLLLRLEQRGRRSRTSRLRAAGRSRAAPRTTLAPVALTSVPLCRAPAWLLRKETWAPLGEAGCWPPAAGEHPHGGARGPRRTGQWCPQGAQRDGAAAPAVLAPRFQLVPLHGKRTGLWRDGAAGLTPPLAWGYRFLGSRKTREALKLGTG